MNLDDALVTFVGESRELLADMETALLQVEQADERDELIHAIFRAAHTIKGSAGLFSLDHIVKFTHLVEHVLDQVRAGRLDVGEPLVAVLLDARDHMASLIDAVADGRLEVDPDLQAKGEPLAAQLRACLARAEGGKAAAAGAAAVAPGNADAAPAAPPGEACAPVRAECASTDHWHLSLRFGPDVLRNGMDPMSFLLYLNTIGRIVSIETVVDALPSAERMDPESNYLGFELAYETQADRQTIQGVFEFVADDCKLVILPPHAEIQRYIELINRQDEPARLGEMLLACGTLTRDELDVALHHQQQAPGRPIGAILVDQGKVPAKVVEAALSKQKTVRENQARDSGSVRVDAAKLDQLINLVGELIIAGAGVNQIAQRRNLPDLHESTSKLNMLVQEVRDSALQLRMVRIGATFSRFQRVVHDVSRELGKDVVLRITGEETELDKTVIEKISDPLMHLVRNSLDHGIESASQRLEAGKPAQGTLSLDAFHDSGSIVITVSDDGSGLNRERILAKAVERGMFESGHHLSDADVHALIFEPGFSTADQVSDLSGRGVGMDVVKRNISALHGTVSVHSTPGQGTNVTIRLPLTLAIIDGFLVGVGKSVYALPLKTIEECVAFSAEPGHDYTNLRGEVLPFIRMRELFDRRDPPARSENIVVLKHANQKAGLVVDTLLGEFQTVIKPLGPMFSNVKCISGSTILGSGEVALIIDVPAVVTRCTQRDRDAGRGGLPLLQREAA